MLSWISWSVIQSRRCLERRDAKSLDQPKAEELPERGCGPPERRRRLVRPTSRMRPRSPSVIDSPEDLA